jgi:predicted PilT family ATPase
VSDLNVTEAAAWSEDAFNQATEYLESAGMDELAAQARGARDRGQQGLDEWHKIEEAAGKLPADELARVGKGAHLLEGQNSSQGVPSSTSVTSGPGQGASASEDAE